MSFSLEEANKPQAESTSLELKYKKEREKYIQTLKDQHAEMVAVREKLQRKEESWRKTELVHLQEQQKNLATIQRQDDEIQNLKSILMKYKIGGSNVETSKLSFQSRQKLDYVTDSQYFNSKSFL